MEDSEIIGLPVSKHDADILIAKARHSPFGKGEKTVVDESVRKSWELDSSQFSLSNPDWSECMETILTAVHRDLGLTCFRHSIRAELYKLLIYEEGAFFKPHQDSEKAPGMFATLVVCLPSKHEGGKVLLSHNKRKLEYDSSETSTFGASFGAWYSDVFHQVEKVTSGRRIVLTYNLVQSEDSIPQKTPDGNAKARIANALRMWEHASAFNTPGFPPYIIYELDHFYSKNSTSLYMLKGRDAARVRSLQAACQETGFNIYLAVFEKTINRDDDCGSEEFDRTEEFEYVTNLDGTNASFSPPYNRDCRLEDYDSEDEEADESEHEGFTGNEGAPSTFWYRHTVVLLVPPSRQLEFSWRPKDKYTLGTEQLRKFRVKAAEDSSAINQLYRLCNVMLDGSAERDSWPGLNYLSTYGAGYGYNYSPPSDSDRSECMVLIREIALEHEWLDIFGRIPSKHKRTPAGVQALAGFLALRGTTIVHDELAKMLKSAVNLAEKCDFFEKLTTAFKEQSAHLEDKAKQKSEFEAWCKLAMDDILGTQAPATTGDGSALARLARKCPVDISDKIATKLESAISQTVAAFVIEFAKDHPDLSGPVQVSYIQKPLESLWSNFHYAQPIQVLFINEYDLAELLTLTSKHTDIPMEDVLGALSAAVSDKVVNADYINDTLCPILKRIMHRQIPALIVEDDPNLFGPVATYIQCVLTAYIQRLVGPEPIRPRDWAIDTKRHNATGCLKGSSCPECLSVVSFLRDPNRRTLHYPINERGRKHLDNEFSHQYGRAKDPQWTVSIDRSCRPFAWVCTKDHKAYMADRPRWTHNRQRAQKMLRHIGSSDVGDDDGSGRGRTGKKPKTAATKGDMVYLRQFLGSSFDSIAECRVETLPPCPSVDPAQPTRKPLDGMGASSLNTAGAGKKRKIDIVDLTESADEPPAKRAEV